MPDAQPRIARRALLRDALALAAFAPGEGMAAPPVEVGNVTGLYPVTVARIVAPKSAEEIGAALREGSGPVAIGGGRYSMGGQVAIDGGLHLDMRAFDGLVWLRPAERRVRVRAGMRWRDLQDHLDPQDLAVKTMQSYANFTVGGSVSVNCHGRYVGNGPIGETAQAQQLEPAGGEVVEASRTQNAALFRAAIGGYGAVGVITEVELALAANERLERVVHEVALDDYGAWFETAVAADGEAVLHNADLMPPAFDAPVAVTWRRTPKPLTDETRLIPRGQRYRTEQALLWAMTELPAGEHLRRSVLHPLLTARPAVVWRNHEASRDTAELEPTRRTLATYALQEYFVPKAHCAAFARAFAAQLLRHRVQALNVSIRHSPPDRSALLAWAPEEVFSFVLYHKQATHPAACEEVGSWTRALIDLALAHGGRYYLPYQLHAGTEQFRRAYPQAEALRAIKREIDPAGRFTNRLWSRYL